MPINTLLKINGTDYTGKILTPFKIGRHKLWGEDTGRVMSGEMQGTLIGIFPKLTVLFYPKTPTELANLMIALDSASQSLDYYNPKTQSLSSFGTYTNDYEVNLINLDPYYAEVQVSFIARAKE